MQDAVDLFVQYLDVLDESYLDTPAEKGTEPVGDQLMYLILKLALSFVTLINTFEQLIAKVRCESILKSEHNRRNTQRNKR
jgi:hypothetical protein